MGLMAERQCATWEALSTILLPTVSPGPLRSGLRSHQMNGVDARQLPGRGSSLRTEISTLKPSALFASLKLSIGSMPTLGSHERRWRRIMRPSRNPGTVSRQLGCRSSERQRGAYAEATVSMGERSDG